VSKSEAFVIQQQLICDLLCLSIFHKTKEVVNVLCHYSLQASATHQLVKCCEETGRV
jgi:hypothetical protein